MPKKQISAKNIRKKLRLTDNGGQVQKSDSSYKNIFNGNKQYKLRSFSDAYVQVKV